MRTSITLRKNMRIFCFIASVLGAPLSCDFMAVFQHGVVLDTSASQRCILNALNASPQVSDIGRFDEGYRDYLSVSYKLKGWFAKVVLITADDGTVIMTNDVNRTNESFSSAERQELNVLLNEVGEQLSLQCKIKNAWTTEVRQSPGAIALRNGTLHHWSAKSKPIEPVIDPVTGKVIFWRTKSQ